MRIALICPTYVQDRSYQENVWAEQLAKMGHDVRVMYAAESTSSSSAPKRIESSLGGYETQEVAAMRLPRGGFRSKALPEVIRSFAPDLIIVCGDKLFSSGVAKDGSLAGVPLISTYSENRGMHEFDWRKPGITLRQRLWAIGFLLVRGGPIRLMCRRSDLILGNTPQAREIILRLFSSDDERRRISEKMIDVPLGFSPEHFGYFPDVRRRVRMELGVSDHEILICASSYFSIAKAPFMKMIVSALDRVMMESAGVKALIIGFCDSTPEQAEISRQIETHIAQSMNAARFIRHPFAQRDRLCELYNGSDIAVFGRASISCQEALGTGLIGCFADDGSTNHLVTRPDQGVFFRPNDQGDLAAKLREAGAILGRHATPDQRAAFRRMLTEAAQWLRYDRIIQTILKEVNDKCKQEDGTR